VKKRAALAFLVAVLVSLPAIAAKAGKYSVTSTTTVNGKSYPSTTSFCLLQEQIDHPEKFAEALNRHGCKVSEFKAEGGVFSWKATCLTAKKGRQIETSGSYTFGADNFEGHQTIRDPEGNLHRIDQKAVWTGSQCDAIR
jgi:hypothetical protein